MANPLAVELAANAAQTVSGVGTAKDIGALRTAGRFLLAVSETSAGSDRLLTVVVETAPAEAGPWRTVGQFGAVQKAGKVDAVFVDLERYVRAKWTIAGAAASFTFSVAGTAHVIYAEPRHVRSLGIQSGALTKVPDSTLGEFCIVASVESDGYLGAGHTLPLAAWDFDLTLHNAKIAVYHYLNGTGRQPTGPDDIIDLGYTNAIKWLKGVGNGSIDPPGLVDATPETEERAYAVVSDPPIEW